MSMFFIIFLSVEVSHPYKEMGITSALYTSISENLWTEFAFKVLLQFPVFEKISLVFVELPISFS
jgi:hypothetical protein